MTIFHSVPRRFIGALSLTIASVFGSGAWAQDTWTLLDEPEPVALLAPGGNALLAMACAEGGMVEMRTMVFGSPGPSTHMTQELQLTTGSWTSETLSFASTESGDAYAVSLDPAGQIVSAMRFAPMVNLFPDGKEMFGFEIPLGGFTEALDGLLARCATSEPEEPRTIVAEAAPVRQFDEAHKVAAAGLIIAGQCQPGNTAAYCANPDVLALRSQQIEAAAAAIARGLDPRQRPDVIGVERPQLLNQLVRCSNDADCLSAFLTERIAFWDGLYQPLDATALAGLDPEMTEICGAAVHPSVQLVCTDPDLAASEAGVRRQIGLMKTEFAQDDVAAAFDGSIARIHDECRAERGCLEQGFAGLEQTLDDWSRDIRAKAAEAERQRIALAQQEREIEAERSRQRAAAEASRNTASVIGTSVFTAPSGPSGAWVREIGLGRFEIARGATRNESEVIASQTRRLRLLAAFYHDVYDNLCEITGPSQSFAQQIDVVTTDGTGREVERMEGELQTIKVRSEYVDIFASGYDLAANPAGLIFSMGANFGQLFEDLATVSRDVIQANGCGSPGLVTFERNLAAVLRGEPSLQRRGEVMTLLERSCIATRLGDMAGRSARSLPVACACISKTLWDGLPEEHLVTVEDGFSRETLLLAAATTPATWEGVQSCVR
ncbi:hypothetical protein [Maritimibacter sp. DP1N21-5]|uniref:hypothetical protein n=1 Tax=Maritimibacter sp. DP1N21-5 TaxID=2836867 RepID=UPI001C4419E6|nr:hypothetical protein [Maritimibacter sp. DP1N21-5]MBV7411110.1 hypothetical protein [Maritimibacter sp. DP1N21-5]